MDKINQESQIFEKKNPETTFEDRLQIIGRRFFEFCAYFSGALLVHMFWFSGYVPLQSYVRGTFWGFCISSMGLIFIYYHAIERSDSLFRMTLISFTLVSLAIVQSNFRSIHVVWKDMAIDILERFGLMFVVFMTFRFMSFVRSICIDKGFLGFLFTREDTELALVQSD